MNRFSRPLERKLERITAAAIEASQQEIALAFDIKFGSPTERLIGELGTYARHLTTYTCDEEEIGNVRPLRDLLADAALTLSIQAKLGTAALAAGSRRAETSEDLAQCEASQSGGGAATPNPRHPSGDSHA